MMRVHVCVQSIVYRFLPSSEIFSRKAKKFNFCAINQPAKLRYILKAFGHQRPCFNEKAQIVKEPPQTATQRDQVTSGRGFLLFSFFSLYF